MSVEAKKVRFDLVVSFEVTLNPVHYPNDFSTQQAVDYNIRQMREDFSNMFKENNGIINVKGEIISASDS